jgi:hypothetical protein
LHLGAAAVESKVDGPIGGEFEESIAPTPRCCLARKAKALNSARADADELALNLPEQKEVRDLVATGDDRPLHPRTERVAAEHQLSEDHDANPARSD